MSWRPASVPPGGLAGLAVQPGGPLGEAEAGVAVRAGSTILERSGPRPFALPASAEAAGCHRDWQVIPSPVPTRGGISMALYMYQASYTARSMAAQLKEPQDPVEAIRPTLEDLGAKMVVAGFPFGEYDVLIVYEAPDDMTAASVAMAVAAEGEVKSAKTTRLLSGQEWLESLRKRRIVTTRKARQPYDPQRQSPELLWSAGRSRGAVRSSLLPRRSRLRRPDCACPASAGGCGIRSTEGMSQPTDGVEMVTQCASCPACADCNELVTDRVGRVVGCSLSVINVSQ